MRDLHFAWRQLRSRPAFAIAAIVSLALGIGLNATLFSIVNGVLFRNTLIAAPDRLVEIYTGINKDFPQLTSSYPDFRDIRAGANALAEVCASSWVRGILTSGGRGMLVTGEAVTANYFRTLGVQSRLGRGFVDGEDDLTATPIAILSHGLWQQHFASRPDVIGQDVTLSGERYTVVGVAPAGFIGSVPGIPADFWVPIHLVERLEFSGVQMNADNDPGATRLERRGSRWLFVKGRLADGRTVQEARAQVETIYARLSREYPVTNEGVTASLVPATSVRFHPLLDSYFRLASAGLLTAVGLVLLIACANVANMLLARGVSRRRELAIRIAIGATRRRVVTQLLAEALILATSGGVLGLAIAWWAGRLLSGIGSDVFPIPIRFDFSIDANVLMFALGATMATAVLFGIAPAWSASKPELVPSLKGEAADRGRRRLHVRDLLVVGQLALSLVLLVAGALLGRGLLTAQQTDLGFDPTRIASLSFNLRMNGYDLDRATALRDRAIESIGGLPGVVAVSTASRLPLAPDINIDGVRVPGVHRPDEDGALTDVVAVGADYFSVVGVPIVAGRGFTPEDVAAERRVVIVNESMATRFWTAGSAVGRQIYVGAADAEPLEIIGIARDHKVRSVGEAPRPYLHVPAGRSLAMGLIVRTQGLAEQALPMLREALWKLEPAIVFTEDASAAEVAATTLTPTRFGAIALGAFGALAVSLAAIGVYGVIAYSVSRRTREVGIRMALGARRAQVLAMVLAQGGRLAAVGVGAGALVSAGIGQVLESLLYGVSRFDPVAYGAAAGVLVGTALVANLIPALTAARVDPMQALRNE